MALTCFAELDLDVQKVRADYINSGDFYPNPAVRQTRFLADKQF